MFRRGKWCLHCLEASLCALHLGGLRPKFLPPRRRRRSHVGISRLENRAQSRSRRQEHGRERRLDSTESLSPRAITRRSVCQLVIVLTACLPGSTSRARCGGRIAKVQIICRSAATFEGDVPLAIATALTSFLAI